MLSKLSLVVAILCVMTVSVTNWPSGLLGLGTYLSTAGPHQWDSIATSCREWDAERQTTLYKTNCAAQCVFLATGIATSFALGGTLERFAEDGGLDGLKHAGRWCLPIWKFAKD